MTIQYPTTLDTLANPSSGDALNSPSHATQHANANDAIEALEAKVGADSSAVSTSHDYKLSEVTDKAVGKTATQTLTNKTLTSPILNLSSNAIGDVYYRAADGTLGRATIGTTGQILTSNGTIPAFADNANAVDASATVKGLVKLDTAPASATEPIAVGVNSAKFDSTAGVGNPPTTSSTQTITHNLGRTPKIIRIKGFGDFFMSTGSSNSNTQPSSSYGTYNSTGNRCTQIDQTLNQSGGRARPSNSTSYAVWIEVNGHTASGIIGNVGTTTFDIVWTISGTNVQYGTYLWEAE